jgi:hypothetical protein
MWAGLLRWCVTETQSISYFNSPKYSKLDGNNVTIYRELAYDDAGVFME